MQTKGFPHDYSIAQIGNSWYECRYANVSVTGLYEDNVIMYDTELDSPQNLKITVSLEELFEFKAKMKHILAFFKNTQAEICLKIENKLRTITWLKF